MDTLQELRVLRRDIFVYLDGVAAGVDTLILDGVVDIVDELVGDLGEHAALCPDQIILYLAGGAGDDLRDKQVIRRVGRLREDTDADIALGECHGIEVV